MLVRSVFFLALILVAIVPVRAGFEITLAFTANVRGNIAPVNTWFNSPCDPSAFYNDTEGCSGGAARHLSFLRDLRAAKNATLGALPGYNATHPVASNWPAVSPVCAQFLSQLGGQDPLFGGANAGLPTWQYPELSWSAACGFAEHTGLLTLDAGGFWWGSFYNYVFGPSVSAQVFSADVGAATVVDFFESPSRLAEFVQGIPSRSCLITSNADVSADVHLGATRSGTVNEKHLVPFAIKYVKTRIFDLPPDATSGDYNDSYVGFVPVAILSVVPADLAQRSSPGDDVVINPTAASTASQLRQTISTVQAAFQQAPPLSHNDTESLLFPSHQTHPPANHPGLIVLLSALSDDELDVLLADFKEIDLVLRGFEEEDGTPGGNFARVTVNELGKQLIEFQVDFFGKQLGKIDLVVTDRDVLANGGVVSHGGAAVNMNFSLPQNDTWVNFTHVKDAELAALIQTPVGTASTFLLGDAGDSISLEGVRYSDTGAGRLLTDAAMDYCGVCDVAFFNSGGIRASFDDGPVTTQNIHEAFPFANTISIFSLPGQHLLDALVHGVETSGPGSGPFPVCAGIRFAYDPAGPQLVEVEVQNSDGGWDPLLLTASYRIVTWSFLRSGLDGYTMFKDFATAALDFGPLADQMVDDYIVANTPIDHIPTRSELLTCRDREMPMRVGAGDCRVLQQASSGIDFFSSCPTNTAWCQSVPMQLLEGFRINNRSDCAVCSGVGTCQDRECVCRRPRTGPFDGLQVATGVDCTLVSTVYRHPLTLRGILYFFAAVGLVVTLVLMGFLWRYRNRRVVRASSPKFGFLLLVGCCLGFVGMIVDLAGGAGDGDEQIGAEEGGGGLDGLPTRGSCTGSLWMYSLSFIVVFGALFSKTYRIKQIFRPKRLRVVRWTDWRLFRLFCVFLGINLVLLLTATFWASDSEVGIPAKGFVLETNADRTSVPGAAGVEPNVLVRVCEVPADRTVSMYLLLIFKAGVIVWGLFVLWGVRRISDASYNESKPLCLAIYNLSIFSLIAGAIFFVLRTVQPGFALALQHLSLFYILLSTELLILAPKFWTVYQGLDDFKPVYGMSSGGLVQTGGRSLFSSSAESSQPTSPPTQPVCTQDDRKTQPRRRSRATSRSTKTLSALVSRIRAAVEYSPASQTVASQSRGKERSSRRGLPRAVSLYEEELLDDELALLSLYYDQHPQEFLTELQYKRKESRARPDPRQHRKASAPVAHEHGLEMRDLKAPSAESYRGRRITLSAPRSDGGDAEDEAWLGSVLGLRGERTPRLSLHQEKAATGGEGHSSTPSATADDSESDSDSATDSGESDSGEESASSVAQDGESSLRRRQVEFVDVIARYVPEAEMHKVHDFLAALGGALGVRHPSFQQHAPRGSHPVSTEPSVSEHAGAGERPSELVITVTGPGEESESDEPMGKGEPQIVEDREEAEGVEGEEEVASDSEWTASE